ncbi:hypothetical protein [Leptolyngbya sp. BC1307]|uniref:hypothetical protein n=1 Tax=Leptolyngbya sp. BC1307 TaxID=2029589 RepID=UPI000EFA8D0A|nr:hypothetical protein [Leptolyngbya sp. BC1307]
MSVSELNHFMTYVIDGWMLFSAGFISIAFVSFVSRRIQEDIAAETAALAQGESQEEAQGEKAIAPVSSSKKVTAIQPAAEATDPSPVSPAEPTDGADTADVEKDAARLEEVAAVSEKLSKAKEKQSGSSSVSVST